MTTDAMNLYRVSFEVSGFNPDDVREQLQDFLKDQEENDFDDIKIKLVRVVEPASGGD